MKTPDQKIRALGIDDEMKIRDRALLKEHGFVNGAWIRAERADSFSVRNPATGMEIGRVANMSSTEANSAIEAAEAALPMWRAKTARARAEVMRNWFDAIIANQEDLAQILTAEQGKPLAESRAEIIYGAAFIEWFAEEAKRVYGDVIPSNNVNSRILILKEPVGVVAAITPWNFPNAMITRKCAPALAAGCTVVLKPSEETPLSAIALAELADRAGIPKGVFNVLPSTKAAEIGGVMTKSPIVRKLSFTGSTRVGKLLLAECAKTVKKVSLELGGNAPFIVFDDADIGAAVNGAMVSKFRNTGQTCVCTNRIFVQDDVYEEFVERLGNEISNLKVGAGIEEGVSQGPLINIKAVEKLERLLADAIERGAIISCGGKRHSLGSTFFQPTVITSITAGMAIANEEIFGPIATIQRFKTEAEAVRAANDTPNGLAAYFYSRDIGRVFRVAEALEYGIVGANDGIISTEVAPFGGVKESGLGREGSKYGIEDYLEIKYLLLGGLN